MACPQGGTNGRLTNKQLRPVYTRSKIPGARLAPGPAAAWNSMALTRAGFWLDANGPDSLYRTFARQVFWRNWWCNQGKCGNAAVPGTSNHGCGLAADVPNKVIELLLRGLGRAFGWRKECSDAPWESWHFKWCGGYGRPNPGPDRRNPVLRRRSGGPGQKRWVRKAQKRLALHGVKVNGKPVRRHGHFGKQTVRAVKRFQARAGLKADGIVGPKTWKALRRKP